MSNIIHYKVKGDKKSAGNASHPPEGIPGYTPHVDLFADLVIGLPTARHVNIPDKNELKLTIVYCSFGQFMIVYQ